MVINLDLEFPASLCLKRIPQNSNGGYAKTKANIMFQLLAFQNK